MIKLYNKLSFIKMIQELISPTGHKMKGLQLLRKIWSLSNHQYDDEKKTQKINLYEILVEVIQECLCLK